MFLIKHIMYYNTIDKYSITLALVYLRYNIDILFNSKYDTLFDYELKRSLMWIFSAPLMLQMYVDTNKKNINELCIHYNLIPMTLNIFIYPFKNNKYVYSIFMIIIYIYFGLFMRLLHNNRNALFTHIYLIIWYTFIIIGTIETTNLVDKFSINLFYLYADLMGKMTTNIVMNDYNGREMYIQYNVDLQCVNFISHMIKCINDYRSNNAAITQKCISYIERVEEQFHRKIPENKDVLQQELLTKILPFGFDKEYINNSSVNAKEFNMICILFTDIVNYTELASRYDVHTIFNLLNSVYIKFDSIIKKYPYLQKIETIGDAYMVVGDIYRNTINHRDVVKNIVIIGMEFIREIKLIKTPDKIPLSIRVGINMGTVSIGILGSVVPRLCVVGNSVNKASRLQSTADVDSIQVSRHIYEQLGEIDFGNIKFNIVQKDDVFLKNIGNATTYNLYPIEIVE